MTVRSNEFGVRRLKTRRGGPQRPPALGARRVAPLHRLNPQTLEPLNPSSGIKTKGFTLIEIIILIVMAGILLPTIIVPFVAGVKASGKPEMVNTAMYLGHQKMEELMKYQYGNSALNPTGLTSYAATGISGYDWQWEIALVDSNFNTSGSDVGYKRILARVRDPMNDTYEIYSVVTNFP